MSKHTFYPDLSDMQPKVSKCAEEVLGYLLAATIGLGLAVLLVHHLSK